ncbi:hypothetical protein LPJ61_001405 [Coemansia biformis]|uniref:valine--tRNA ligase n=1 Tax=Coemansia biformis TaxID=1286918 RepID=A0A9W7YA23_9FUNG|nr:hypothetical protein LPJ61_001405 [Coemansia biformis]
MATQARIGSLISGRLIAGRWAQTSLRFLATRRTYAAPVHDFEKYNPEVVERDWYEWWQRRGLFQPKQGDDASSAGRFSMLLPPPNVTGILHIGHALTLSIQDAMARWNRMHGRSVNWVPGTDHAGISMQSVVEKKLKRETGQTRHDLGRSAFIAEVWKWKQEHSSHIKDQTMRIGASLNWDAEFFTMDAQHSQVVSEAFIRLYDAGLIYRATKMVNWSCALQSVISDIEFGVLHAIEFPIIDPPSGGPRMLRVETTRPETMLGDVALAIGSGDARYKVGWAFLGVAVANTVLQRRQAASLARSMCALISS